MSDSTQRHREGRSSLLQRSIPLMALALPTVLSILLVSTSHVRMLGSMRKELEFHQTTVTVLVQILSTTMGTLQVATLTSVVGAGFRLRLASRPLQLGTIGLLNAIIVPRIPWGLSSKSVLLAAIVVILAQGPGALWAGALNTAAVSSEVMLGSAAVPVYQEPTAGVPVWDSEFSVDNETHVWNLVQNCLAARISDENLAATSVSNCPVPNYQTQLLQSARDASTGGGVTMRNHSKLDSPTWLYRGRSYGVGASQGLKSLKDVPGDHELLSYSYNETGYQTTVDCKVNTTAALSFTLREHVDNVFIWKVVGTLPNSISSEVYPVMAWNRDSFNESSVLAWVGVSNNVSDTYMIGVVASPIYGDFNKIQCEVNFEPALFDVVVNATEQTINVSVIDIPTDQVADIDPIGHLRQNCIWSVNLLSRMSTSLYVSVLGEALAHNLETVSALLNTTDNGPDRATAESFTAMLDDILGIYAGSQLVFAGGLGGQAAAKIRGEFSALRIGQPPYQFAVLGVNAALLLLVLAEGLRTRWWRHLPSFDTLDFETVVDCTLAKGSTARGLWALQWCGDDRRVSIKMIKCGGDDEVGQETCAANSQYVKIEDSDDTASNST